MKIKSAVAGLITAGLFAALLPLANATTNAVPIQDLMIVSEKGDMNALTTKVSFREYHRGRHGYEHRHRGFEHRRRGYEHRHRTNFNNNSADYPSPQVQLAS